ncbi:MAG: restriction endonuclease subunit S [Lachnospiraceae bacterium]|nr:restriction endonuclease subunit S [Lachnospiraceae bacterium]
MSFEYVKLGEISDITKLAGFEFTKYIEYIEDGEIIALRALNLRKGELDLTDIKRIDRDVSDTLTRSKLYINDILLTYTGNGYGDCAMITENDKYHLAPNICKITPDIKKVDPYYLYSYIRSNDFYQEMSGNMTGSSQPTIPMKTIRVLQVPLPPRDTQEKISFIIRNIDEKIRITRKIANNLHEQAYAIFLEEIAQKVNIPHNWQEGCLNDIANYLNGLAMQKYRPSEDEEGLPVLKIRELRQGMCDNNSEKCSPSIKQEYIVKNGDVVFSWSGSLLVDYWCGGECGLNQHLFKVSSDRFDSWFYYSWTLFHLEKFIAVAADKATTMGHIKREELEKAKVMIPDKEEYDRISRIIKPLYELMISSRIVCSRLMEMRDALLPQLLEETLDIGGITI